MASTNLTGIIDLSSTNGVSLMMASAETTQTNGRFDMPLNYCFDLNITSTDAEGTVEIFLQNDDPTTSTFTQTGKLTFAVASGTFGSSQTKQTVDSQGLAYTKYVYIKYTRTAGSGTIAINGQKTYRG